MNDAIDDAIEGAERNIQMITIPVALSETGGRPCQISVPVDMTAAELLELIGWLSVPRGLKAILDSQLGHRPRLIVPRGSVQQ